MTALHQLSDPLPLPWLALLGRGLCGLVLCAGLAHGAGYESWSKVEQAQETSDYGQRLREGKFEAEQKAFVEQILLPQLDYTHKPCNFVEIMPRLQEHQLRGKG